VRIAWRAVALYRVLNVTISLRYLDELRSAGVSELTNLACPTSLTHARTGAWETMRPTNRKTAAPKAAICLGDGLNSG
jgi:hypothetical protein